ncbi:MAG: bifunctional phosphopantothenoylcysteine decarboxylase/phosphopantothenate--cysteine ligase CoaBC [Vulcanibacillus sp.]
MRILNGKKIVLGITGGIAAYKAATITSMLVKKGAEVQVIMTEASTKIIPPFTLQILSKKHVYTDTFDEYNPDIVAHINIANNADLVLIAPATANVIAKLAYGIADDMLTTTLLAVKCPIFIAPSMNENMYFHPTVQGNIAILKARGIKIIEPSEGRLAEGYSGKGRLPEPEEILEIIEEHLTREKDFLGKKFLITAGPTRESIDSVRFITNHSSGKMGYALAEVALERGGEVILISGKTNILPPNGVQLISIETAEQMYQKVIDNLESTDIIIKTAAVADYRPKNIYPGKFKKKDEAWFIEMERTKDIALEIGNRKSEGQLLIGFCAESEDLIKNAKAKLKAKNMDMIVANNILTEGAGFEGDTNIVTLISKLGKEVTYPIMSKKELAYRILTEINSCLGGKKE